MPRARNGDHPVQAASSRPGASVTEALEKRRGVSRRDTSPELRPPQDRARLRILPDRRHGPRRDLGAPGPPPRRTAADPVGSHTIRPQLSVGSCPDRRPRRPGESAYAIGAARPVGRGGARALHRARALGRAASAAASAITAESSRSRRGSHECRTISSYSQAAEG